MTDVVGAVDRRRARVVLDLVRAQREGAGALAQRRAERLNALVTYARSRSSSYRDHYSGLPMGRVQPEQLPPVTKTQLMARFDQWVSDPAVTRAVVEEFIADPTRVGQSLLDRYFVCASGTTGEPGIFVHDPAAMVVYRSFSVRADLTWLSAGDWVSLARRGFRCAAVVGTGGHFGAEAWMEHQRSRSLWCRHTYRVFSVQQPCRRWCARSRSPTRPSSPATPAPPPCPRSSRVRLERDTDPPEPSARSGKFHQILAMPQTDRGSSPDG